MLRYITLRLLGAIPTMLLIITAAFFLMRVAPGGPFASERALPPEIEARILAHYKLDLPLWQQYLDYLRHILVGDFGPSFRVRDFTVFELLKTGFPVSLKLGVLALIVAAVFGIAAGIAAALRQNTRLDYLVMSSAMTGIAIPNFVMAPLLTLVLGVYLSWLPVGGWNDGALRNMILPITALALPKIAYIARADCAEAIAADGAFYYLVGSHALSRGGELQPSRFFVYRVPVDPATGAPSGAAVRSAGLRNLIEGVAPLRAHAGQPIAAAGSDGHGVNIEGLAVRDGQLYVGFRGPVLDGTAYLLRVAAAPLFAGQPADPRLLPIALGPGRGVRDLAAVASGLLVLAGPEADQGATFALFFWDGSGARPRLLGELSKGQEAKAKPEGLLVLDEDAASYRVLVFHDGARDGAPAAYRLPKAE